MNCITPILKFTTISHSQHCLASMSQSDLVPMNRKGDIILSFLMFLISLGKKIDLMLYENHCF